MCAFGKTFLLNTFDVNSGQNVLEGGGMKQVTHFLLGLRFKHIERKGSFRVKEQHSPYLQTPLHAGSHEVMLIFSLKLTTASKA